ncbi:MAG: lysophospholipid acyltransferase family protein [Methylacidiphilales bacterium]|nr:lysophospholipid acyltransferase family protein [Candidatus Methylacidiphilales bacterium]
MISKADPQAPGTDHISRRFYSVRWFSLADIAARWIPRFVMRPVLGAFGYLYALTHPAKVAVVRKNLSLLGPEPVSFHEACCVYNEFGRVLADYFYAGTRSHDTTLALISERLGREHLKNAKKEGKGAIILTAHLGFFELGSFLGIELGFPRVALTQAEPSPELTRWRADYRARWGVETIEIGKDQFSFLQVLDELKQGKFVASLFDRPNPNLSTPVSAPNGRVFCTGGVFLLARMAECPVVLVTTVVKPDGTYRAEAHPPFFVKSMASREETIRHYSQLSMDMLLPTLQKYRRQWFQFVPLSEAGKG